MGCHDSFFIFANLSQIRIVGAIFYPDWFFFLVQKLSYLTLKKSFQYEIPKIKGSRFIATLFPITAEEQIEEQLAKLRNHYHNATHNCYAWRFPAHAYQDIFAEWKVEPQNQRANDDGEPTNTAGKPILTVLEGKEIFNVLAVVTRFFWGTLLGVGGLIQAYTESVQQALNFAEEQGLLIAQEILSQYQIDYPYEKIASIQQVIDTLGLKILDDQYGGVIQKKVSVNTALASSLEQELRDLQIEFKVLE